MEGNNNDDNSTKVTSLHQPSKTCNMTENDNEMRQELNSQTDDVDFEEKLLSGHDDVSEDINTDDVSTKTTDSSLYAPDGGWGWMVTLASFMVAFIVDGIVTSFGLLLPELRKAFGAGVSLTSFPPAIIVAMFLLSGPTTAYLVGRWGCRPVCFLGGLVATLGMVGSAFAPSIEVFILSFGVVAGVGVGLIYLPSITMVNLYFSKKRGVVAGIITSGSGFGLLAMAPLTEVLMETFGWRGCYLIMAGITLNFCVCASLMRPLSSPTHSLAYETVATGEQDGRQNNTEDEGTSESDLSVTRCRGCHTGGDASCKELHPFSSHEKCLKCLDITNGLSVPKSAKRLGVPDKNSDFSIVSLEEVKDDSDVKDAHAQSCQTQLPVRRIIPSHVWRSSDTPLLGGSHRFLSRDGETGLTIKRRSVSHGHLPSECSPAFLRPIPNSRVNILSTWLACQSVSHSSIHSHQSMDKLGHHLSSHQKELGLSWHRLVNSFPRSSPSVEAGLEDRLSRKGLCRNDHHVAERLTKKHLEAFHSSVSSLKTNPTSSGKSSAHRDSNLCRCSGGGGMVGLVRKHRVFVLFLVGAFLIQLVNNIPAILVPSYGYVHGVSKEQVATILAVFGILNTAGRLGAGLMVYLGCSSLRVYNLGILLSGLACFAFPLCQDFPTITLALGLHGLFLGAFPPLQSVILVEYLGLDRLSSTFGTMCLVKAFASTAGAPLAGLLYSMTGLYTVPITACGGILLVAAVFHQMMDCCSCCP